MSGYNNYKYKFVGKVSHGNKIGRKMGIPTVNIPVYEDNPPQFGVYAAMVRIGNDKLYSGIANIGVKPTVDNNGIPNPVGIEVNLFDFEEDLYDADIEVYFYDFIRPEKKFDSIDALKLQIEKDIIRTKEVLRALE